MNPAELFSFRQPRWFENLVGVAFLAAALATGFIMLALSAKDGSFMEKASLIAVVLSVFAGIWGGVSFLHRYEEQRKKAISKRLDPLDTPQLVALSGSPEVNEYDRSLVRDFLNSHRPGWSFCVDTVNTTTA